MGFSSLPFTANLVPESPAVLIATDDFLRLKRGFATVDGRRLSRRDENAKPRPTTAATTRYGRSL